MDYYIYYLFGYKTEKHLNNSAIIIQKCYRNYKHYIYQKNIIKNMFNLNNSALKIQKFYKKYKNYQKQLKLNIIHRKNIFQESDLLININNKDELNYWYNMRKNIKKSN